MLQDRMSEELKIVLGKMCSYVDADFNTMDFEDHYWYTKYTWTEEQLKDFEYWFINYLRENKSARTQLMPFPSNKVKIIKRFVTNFIFYCGWKEV